METTKYSHQYLWEGIGISSYLLINFWFTRIQANKSAIKALVVNRVGDMFLSVAFFAIFLVFGNLDYATVFSIAPFINEQIITIIGILLLLAAIGKSAQFGLHTWLPDAMEGWVYISTKSKNYTLNFINHHYTDNLSTSFIAECSIKSINKHNSNIIGIITGCILRRWISSKTDKKPKCALHNNNKGI